MGARCRPYDSRDREQWNALLTFVSAKTFLGLRFRCGAHKVLAKVVGCCGPGARRSPYRLPRRVRTFHSLDLNPVQNKTS